MSTLYLIVNGLVIAVTAAIIGLGIWVMVKYVWKKTDKGSSAGREGCPTCGNALRYEKTPKDADRSGYWLCLSCGYRKDVK